MACIRTALLGTLAFVSASPCFPATQASIPDALQQEAMTCVGEAMQICPDVWTAEDHGLACMTGKRAAFSPRCRLIYDKVDQAIHPTSRPSRSASQHDHAQTHQAQY